MLSDEVFKDTKNNIKLDIIAGTSIGEINVAIISGSRNKESYIYIDKRKVELSALLKFLDKSIDSNYNGISKFLQLEKFVAMRKEQDLKLKHISSFYSSSIFGNDKMFKPRWDHEFILTDPE